MAYYICVTVTNSATLAKQKAKMQPNEGEEFACTLCPEKFTKMEHVVSHSRGEHNCH